MSIPTTAPYQANPVTGVFGTGNMRFFTSSGTFSVPAGVGKLRVRIWGAGGANGGGGGGGFSLITIYNLAGVTSIPVTVGASTGTSTTANGGTSSFGSYASATGGLSATNGNSGGSGSGGDINTIGGTGVTNYGCGGSGSLFGNGGNGGANGYNGNPGTGGAGGGGASTTYVGGAGLLAVPTQYFTNGSPNLAQTFAQPFSIDFLGTGTGGGGTPASNGGGAASAVPGGFPGGGGFPSGAGLVIVEW